MRGVCSGPVLVLVSLCLLETVIGSYVITTPRKWSIGSKAQICMTVSERSPEDRLLVTLTKSKGPNHGGPFWGGFRPDPPAGEPSAEEKVLIPERVIIPVGDELQSCDEVFVPEGTDLSYGKLELVGKLGGVDVNKTVDISFNSLSKKTFVQTDKYLYKAGQKVQFRVLTIEGPFFEVSTEPYSEIFVETPSGSRIAQWLNVSNPAGLVHLDLQLIEEPEEGVYSIKVRGGPSGQTITKKFKIEDYVLPRFEVTVKPPNYVLADADILKLQVCATYTFGQPVKGNVSVALSNNGWGSHKIEMNFKDQVFGCKDLEIPLRTFGINNRNYFVYSLTATVEVEEEGTGTVLGSKADVSITRTVLTIKDVGETSGYTKPELPYTNTIKAEFPDGSPAPQEPMSVCVLDLCRNMTTDAAGRLTYTLPPHLLTGSPKIKSLNYQSRKLPNSKHRTYMYESNYYSHMKKSYSPTNSSLLIRPSNTRLSCSGGQNINLQLPVMYAAVNTSQAQVYVQVISRGQIQYWTSVPVQFTEAPLDLDEATLVAPIKAPHSAFTVRGEFVLELSLPSTISPHVHVLVWYSRTDGEVVSDARELSVEKCLNHQVQMSWPKNRVEQGSTLPLTLSAEPNSLCSLGIVDKSVELLSSAQDSLTLEKVFDLAQNAEIGDHENSQIDDYEYCKKKFPPKDKVPDEEPLVPPPPPPMIDEPEILIGEADDVPMVADAVDETEAPRSKRSSPPRYNHFQYTTDVVDALKMFDKSGLHVISDLTVETRPCTERHAVYTAYSFSSDLDAPEMVMETPVYFSMSRDDSPLPANINSPFGASEDKPRTYFPETWLWQLTLLPSSGEHIQELTLPDTITEWVGKAVCVHPTKGLGLSGSTSITTFTPFFIDLTVLPFVKKGEIMPIKISVFNYLEASLPVLITLDSSSEYEILGVNGTEALADQAVAGVRSVCIPSNDKQTVEVRVRPLAVGAVNVSVTAVVHTEYPGQCGPQVIVNKVDHIISPITVEYEGFPREKTWTKYMCSKDLNENLDFFEEWRLEAPANIVNESERAWVTVVGDLLGPTLENLGNLIRMPYGCGEQNMLNFAPNIYVLQYLEASDQSTAAAVEKLTRFMKSGYQRELNYKHRDGSYSAFGESDNSGSTWLTAFVVKSFAQAQQYISVDSTELSMSRDWLKLRQLENGCFESVGKVLHKGMKGGLSDGGRPRVLSAYVMAALLDAGEDPAGDVIPNAVYCLLAADNSTDPYELALIAYALNLARLPEAKEAMNRLMSLAVDSSAGLYWELPRSKPSSKNSATPAVAVETAGYALMAMMANDPVLYSVSAHRIVKWISAQRNSQGGFISTQDTVVALQALAMYESHQSQEPLNLMVSVTGENLAASFKVLESNKLLSQRVEVTKVPTDVLLDMAGTGCCLVQGVVRYNVKDPEPSEAFGMSVSTSLDYGPNSCKKRKIRTCATYLLNDGESNMAVIEVTLVSGYIPVKEDLKRIVGYGTGIIKRYEVDGNKVLFYVDQFTARETCVEFSISQEVKVENAKPGTVKVYDYYEPEFFVSEKYELQQRWSCQNNVPEREILELGIIEEELVAVELEAEYGDDVQPPTTTEGTVSVTDLDALIGALDELP